MDFVLENGLKFGCPMAKFGGRRIPRWGDVAEQGLRNWLVAAGYSSF
jgi:hypothetical protein